MRVKVKLVLAAVRKRSRGFLTTLAELAGLASITAGCWQVYPPAGLIAAGIGLVLVGMVQA
jgi:hypothetical protein